MTLTLQIPGVSLGALIGSGGMGSVYAGVNDTTGEAVAVKVLSGDRRTESMRLRFEREAQAMLALRHPNIARALSYGAAEGGRLYLVMERLKGRDLARHLDLSPRLSLREAVTMAAQAAAGLAAAHESGLVHRDVKPSNLFLHQAPGDAQPTVKVLDFGLAIIADSESTRVTRTGEVLGTPAYMAPEQATGGRALDTRSDVYALGAVLYHMLVGTPPFGRGSPIEVLVRALTEEVPPLRSARHEVPEALAELVHRALVREPAGRLPSMTALLDGLLGLGALSADAVSSRGSAPLRLAADRRIVTLLVATGVTDGARVVAAVEAQGGEASLLGTQVVGVFGAERSVGDEAERAVRAALACEDAAFSISVAASRAGTTAGPTGDRPLPEADTLTHSVSDPGVRIDAETWRRTRGRFVVDGDRVLGEQPTAEVATLVSPFVGRSSELLELRMLVERVADGEPAVAVLLTGAPGVGKSRLVLGVVDAVESTGRGLVFAYARGDTTRRYASWGLLADVVRGFPGAAEASAVGASAWGRYELTTAAAEVLTALVSPGAQRGNVGGAYGDAQAARDRLLLAVGDLFEAVLSAAPLVLVVEDLHEADTPSIELLDALLGRLRDLPLVVLATAREHFVAERPGLFASGGVRRVPLRELDRRAAVELAQAFGLSADEGERLAAHTGGNPLFIEQLAAVRGQPAASGVPLTIEEAVQARLDPLPRHVRDGIRVASAFGVGFDTAGLLAVGLDDASAVVDRLVREDLIQLDRRRGRGQGTAYHFRCALLRDVAYAGLTHEQRRELHCRIGGLLASRPGAAAEAAHHLTLGGEGARAVPLWLEAARGALLGGDLRAARSGLDQALPLAVGGPLEGAVRLQRLGVVVRSGDVAAARAELEALAPLRPQAADFDAEWAYWSAAIAQWEGRHRDSRDGFARAAQLFAGQGDTLAVSRALAMQAVQICTGQLGDARPTAEEAILAAGDDPAARARALHTRYYVAGYADTPAVARRLAFDALAACELASDAGRGLEVLTTLAADELELGSLAAAEARLDAVVERARRLGNEVAVGYAVHNLGVVSARGGRYALSLERQSAALEVATRLQQPRLAGAALYHRALARLELGDLAGAAADADAALPRVRGSTEESSALTARALVHKASGELAAGLACVHAARERVDSTGHRPELEAELLACEVALLQQSGRVAEADVRRDEAVVRVMARAQALTETPEARAAYLGGNASRKWLLGGDAVTPVVNQEVE